MADVFLSYASEDVATANALRNALVERGIDVWMDKPDEGNRAELPLPAGQRHWPVIAGEILRAGLVFELATTTWQAKGYCQLEHDEAERLGKWVLADQAPDADRLADLVEERRTYVSAHARLLVLEATSQDPEQPVSRLTQLRSGLSLPRGARDAEVVLGADPAQFGVTLTDSLSEFAAAALVAAHSRRVRIRRLVAGIVSVLTATAIVATVALAFAIVAERRAVEADRAAQARRLLVSSSAAVNTAEGIGAARASLELVNSPEAETAELLAINRDRRQRTIPLLSGTYSAAAWSSEQDIIVAMTEWNALQIDVADGSVTASVGLPTQPREPGLVVAPDPSIAFAATDMGVVRVDFANDEARLIRPGVHMSLSSDGEGSVWFGDAEGLGHANVSSGIWDESSERTPVAGGVAALTVSGSHIDVVTGNADLLSFSIATGAPVEVARSALEGIEPGDQSVQEAYVIRCGDSVAGFSRKGGTLAYFRFAWLPDSGAAAETAKEGSGSISMACGWDDRPLWGSSTSSLQPIDPSAPIPHSRYRSSQDLIVADPRGSRFAVIDDEARLSIYSELDSAAGIYRSHREEMPQAAFLLGERPVALFGGERIVDILTGAQIAQLEMPIGSTSGVISMSWQSHVTGGDCGAFGPAQAGVQFISPDGEVRIIPTSQGTLLDSHFGGASSTFITMRPGLAVATDECGLEPKEIPFSKVDTQLELAVAADLSADGEKIVTLSFGGDLAIRSVEDTEVVLHSAATQVVGQGFVLWLSDGRILVLTRDGRLSVWTPDLERIGVIDSGANVSWGMRVVGNRLLVVVDRDDSYDTDIYDLDSLAVVDRLERVWVTSPPVVVEGRQHWVGISADARIVFVPRLDE